MKIIKSILLLFLIICIFSCNSNSQQKKNSNQDSVIIENTEEDFLCEDFPRDRIINNMKAKIKIGLPLVVKIFVPLCDNEHQGIVPVNKSLGDGLNLRTNLYWGAGYGIKTHFTRKKAWKTVSSQKDIDSNILERIVFRKRLKNTDIILIADAYRGDRMYNCMEDYFGALAGTHQDTCFSTIDTTILTSNVDFFIFNGHNGLMDMPIDFHYNKDEHYKDAAVISCMSASYFIDHLKCLKAFPLITTCDLLPPEAYVAEAIINAWAQMKTEEEIRLSAGDAMFRIHKRNQKAMRNIFVTGW